MEKQPKSQLELLSYYERQRLLKRIFEVADFYHAQMIAAPRHIRGIYIPILSSVKLLWDGGLPPTELAHLRKVVAAQSHHLKEVHEEARGLKEFHETVQSLAGTEMEEHNALGPAQRGHHREWVFATRDAAKIFQHVAFAERDLEG
ncbi:MAG TPA: hypothetical protein VIK37_00130 [Candidatus Saccharimonadales bacterium]